MFIQSLKTSLFILTALSCLFVMNSCDRQEKIEIKKVKVNDIEIAYYTKGSGEPLIMIMGFRGTMAIWDPAMLDILAKKFTLVLFDNRGAGLSTDSEQDLTTITQMANDTAGLIKALGYENAHVLGWSMGSRIALELALIYPEIVNTLTLCAPNPGGKYQAKRTSDVYKKLSARNLSQEEGLSVLFPDNTTGQKAMAEFVGRVSLGMIRGTVPENMTVPPDTIERQVRALKLWNENNTIYEMLSTIKTPTLVTGGLADVLSEAENVRLIAERIPFAWTAYFPHAGHNFLSQDNEAFSALVTIFIETNRR